MADEKRSDSAGAAAQPATEGMHVVKCVKFGREMPGLDRIPWKGEIGKRVYDNVSKEAWKLWVEHSKMLMNEFRLNPLDPNSQKVMEEQMEMFFFGEGAKLPQDYVLKALDPDSLLLVAGYESLTPVDSRVFSSRAVAPVYFVSDHRKVGARCCSNRAGGFSSSGQAIQESRAESLLLAGKLIAERVTRPAGDNVFAGRVETTDYS